MDRNGSEEHAHQHTNATIPLLLLIGGTRLLLPLHLHVARSCSPLACIMSCSLWQPLWTSDVLSMLATTCHASLHCSWARPASSAVAPSPPKHATACQREPTHAHQSPAVEASSPQRSASQFLGDRLYTAMALVYALPHLKRHRRVVGASSRAAHHQRVLARRVRVIARGGPRPRPRRGG
jgi:hypothetical protein